MSGKILVVGIALILPIHGQQQGAKATQQKATTTKATKNVPGATPPAIVNVINQQTADQNGDGAKGKTKGYFSRLFCAPENGPNIALAIAGFVGIGVAIRTLYWLKTQTRAIQSQTTMAQQQSAIMYSQWVDLDNWKTELSTNPLDRLHVWVDIGNSTAFPMTITEVSLNIGATGFTLSERVFLPPKKTTTVDFTKYVDEGTVKRFDTGTLILPTQGSVSHFGPLGPKTTTTESFEGLLRCGKPALMHYTRHMNPDHAGQEDPKNQPAN